MIGKKFKSNFSIELVEYEVVREDIPGFYVVQSTTGATRIMDARILKPLTSGGN